MKVALQKQQRIFSVINDRFLSFRSHVPSEFERKPRTLKEFAQFKANECRQLLLYNIPVLLKDLVSQQMYNELMRLHVAMRLLADPLRYRENISGARKLIEEFVYDYDEIFGKENFTFNTHILLHLPDYVKKYGPVYSFSAYKYENYMRLIKRLLRRESGHIQQFFNRIEEMRFAAELEESDGVRTKSRYNEFVLEPNSKSDAYCMIDSGSPVVVTGSFNRDGAKWLRGKRFMEYADFYDEPIPSMENMGIILACNLSMVEEEFAASSVAYKFFHLPYEEKSVLIPILHTN